MAVKTHHELIAETSKKNKNIQITENEQEHANYRIFIGKFFYIIFGRAENQEERNWRDSREEKAILDCLVKENIRKDRNGKSMRAPIF